VRSMTCDRVSGTRSFASNVCFLTRNWRNVGQFWARKIPEAFFWPILGPHVGCSFHYFRCFGCQFGYLGHEFSDVLSSALYSCRLLSPKWSRLRRNRGRLAASRSLQKLGCVAACVFLTFRSSSCCHSSDTRFVFM